jgi:hypothetical protein
VCHCAYDLSKHLGMAQSVTIQECLLNVKHLSEVNLRQNCPDIALGYRD